MGRLLATLRRFEPIFLSFTTIASALSVGVALLMTWCVAELKEVKQMALDYLVDEFPKLPFDSFAFEFCFNFAWSAVFAVVACNLCVRTGPSAVGSGIPELSSCFSGYLSDTYLTSRVLVVRWIALTGVLTAGFMTGREGPQAHIAAGIAFWMFNFLNRRIEKGVGRMARRRNNEQIDTSGPAVLNSMGAAASAGVYATFGSIAGAVVFSIELLEASSGISYLLLLLYAVCIAGVLTVVTDTVHLIEPFTVPVDFVSHTLKFHNTEFALFILLGFIMGLVSVVFIKGTSVFSAFRRAMELKGSSRKQRFSLAVYVILIAAVTVVTSLKMPLLGLRSIHDTLSDLMFSVTTEKPLAWVDNLDWSFLVCGSVQLLLSVLAVSCPVPSGVFNPTLLGGAALGRGLALLVNRWGVLPYTLSPQLYALLGGVALSAGVSHTLSPIFILADLLGSPASLVPLSVGGITAVAVCSAMSPSVYLEIVKNKGLPYLPPSSMTEDDGTDDSTASLVKRTPASAIMQGGDILPNKCRAGPLNDLVSSRLATVFQIVDEEGRLLGEAPRFAVVKLCKENMPRKDRGVKTGCLRPRRRGLGNQRETFDIEMAPVGPSRARPTLVREESPLNDASVSITMDSSLPATPRTPASPRTPRQEPARSDASTASTASNLSASRSQRALKVVKSSTLSGSHMNDFPPIEDGTDEVEGYVIDLAEQLPRDAACKFGINTAPTICLPDASLASLGAAARSAPFERLLVVNSRHVLLGVVHRKSLWSMLPIAAAHGSFMRQGQSPLSSSKLGL